MGVLKMNISKLLKAAGRSDLWNLFSKKEEYSPLILDKHERFPYYLSTQRDVLDPKVSKFLVKNGLNIKFPEEKKFALVLTHDIDTIHSSLSIKKSFKYLSKYQINNLKQNIFGSFMKKYNPKNNFKEIISLEEKYGAKSTFFFLMNEERQKEYTPDYKIEELERELKHIKDKGWEIGLHGSYYAYNNYQKINKEKKKLEKVLSGKIIGYRNHYLRFKTPKTWKILSKAGFEYDTTFGYADMVGFRNGMCHPFRPYNLNENKEIDIIEIPLHIMDGTLFNYMKLNPKKAWEMIKKIIDITKKQNGIVTLLWHNTYMQNDYLKLYEKILKYCKKLNGWITSAKDVHEMCRNSYL